MKQHVTTAVTRHQQVLSFPVSSGSIRPAKLDEIFHQGAADTLFFRQKHVQKIKIHLDQPVPTMEST